MKFKSLYSLLFLFALNSTYVKSQVKLNTPEQLNNVKNNFKFYGDSNKIVVINSAGNLAKNKNMFFVKENKKWGLINTKTNEVIIPFEIDSIFLMTPLPITIYNIKRNNVWESFIFDEDYNIVKKAKSKNKRSAMDDYMNTFEWFEVLFNGKLGYVNKNFEIIIPIKYDYIDENFVSRNKDVYENLYLLYNDNKVGMFYRNRLIEPIYDEISTKMFENGEIKDPLLIEGEYFCAKKNNKYGLLNFNEEIIIPFEYDDFYFCNVNDVKYSDIYIVKKGKNYGLLTRKETIIPIEYEDLIYLKGTDSDSFLFSAKKNGKYGIINANNKVIVPFEYQSIEMTYLQTKKTNLVVQKNNLYGVIDINNIILVPIENTSGKELLFYH